MALLIQFLLRLTFGLALGMLITSPKRVTSGYFRNHLYVTLGLSALAGLLSFSLAPETFWYAVAAVACSYLGAIYWLFEKAGPGRLMLLLVTLAALVGAMRQSIPIAATQEIQASSLDQLTNSLTEPTESEIPNATEMSKTSVKNAFFTQAAIVSSGLLLGMTMAAMLLGHWYLNSPTMELVPLRRLIIAMAVAVTLQTILSSWGLWSQISHSEVAMQWILFVALRWTFGLIGVAVMVWMAWQTLKIPNTQSATGILYVAVIGTFVGETMALLLSTESVFPL